LDFGDESSNDKSRPALLAIGCSYYFIILFPSPGATACIIEFIDISLGYGTTICIVVSFLHSPAQMAIDT
jgi:hypothetical protein